MSDRIAVYVYAHDPISQAGLASQLRVRPELHVVDDDVDQAQVAVVVVDEVDEETTRVVRAIQRNNGIPRVVLVVTRLDDGGMLAGVEAGACALLRRSEALPERLLAAVRAAATGDGSVPSDLLGRLLEHVGQLQRQVLSPRGLTLSGLTEREIEVLRLVADGYDTAEIATSLAYSERTIKNVIHDVTARLNLRNRSHAVAYAVRQGLI
ncbi:MAG: LuxR C-terminal-related transcriptional regulator [Actinobacteria bacterium]|nr:LuxR C-terminal-related transcriptional regulator [Actinomycetota bacterium]MBW3649191.1 LuxR C-terminal-related transcriptional regulator [Actinomycetota bacterium]